MFDFDGVIVDSELYAKDLLIRVIRENYGTEISEDGIKDLEDELQKITDKYIEKIDKMVEAKSKEIMTV